MNFKRPASLHQVDLADAIGLAVFAGLTVLFVFGLVAPIAMHDRLAASQLEAANRQRQRAHLIAANIRDAKADLDRAAAQLASSPMRIRPLATLNERLATLIALAGDSHVALADVKPGESVHAKRYVVLPIHLQGSGSYADVTCFLHSLQQRMPDMAVGGFKLVGARDGANAAALCEVDLRWIADPAETGSQVAQLPVN